MSSIDNVNIIGKWDNDTIRYVFHKDSSIDIFWKHDCSSSEGEFLIDNDSISVRYGRTREKLWRGKINYITKTELSITDLSNDVGTIDVLYRAEVAMPKALADNDKTPVLKKNFKTLLLDRSGIIGGVGFLFAIAGFIVYRLYNLLLEESDQYQSVLLGGSLIFIISGLILTSDIKGPKGFLFDIIRENSITSLILVPLIIVAIVPVFIILVNIIIFILTLWYYWLIIILVITLFFVWFSEINNFRKILLTVLIILSIYFFFGAKDIIRFDFQSYYDREKLF